MKFSLIISGQKIVNKLRVGRLLAYARERMDDDEADLLYAHVSNEPPIGKQFQIGKYTIIRIS